MSSAGLHPTEELEFPVMVSKERLAEFDRLYAEGGMEAVLDGALPRADESGGLT